MSDKSNKVMGDSPSLTECVLTMKNVTKEYDQFLLDHITMEIPRGSIVGLVGENGAGKTTLLKCILQMIQKSDGEITYEGTLVEELSDQWKEDVGVILPKMDFAYSMTAAQVGRIMENIYTQWQPEIYAQYLKRLKISQEKKIKDYSEGMKRKLNIAISLSHQAKLLIYDEATSGLDPVVRDDILDILLEFMEDENHSVILSSHIISDLEKVADYIAFLHEGKLRFFMNKDELLYEYGVVRGSEQQIQALPTELVKGIRRNQFGCEALVRQVDEVRRSYPELTVDPTNIEEMIVFLVKGESR